MNKLTDFTDALIDPSPSPTDRVYEIRSYKSIADNTIDKIEPWISEPVPRRRTISAKERKKRTAKKKAAKKAMRQNRR